MARGVSANHIYACDIDKDICDAVQKMLPPGHFRLGSFFAQKDWEGKFDVVIGNPPFVRIRNIPEDTKKRLQILISALERMTCIMLFMSME